MAGIFFLGKRNSPPRPLGDGTGNDKLYLTLYGVIAPFAAMVYNVPVATPPGEY